MSEAPDGRNALRLFVAVEPAPELRRAVVQLQRQFQAADLFAGRYTPPENLHLTLKFLGKVEAGAVPALVDALGAVPFEPFRAQLGPVGTFRQRGRLRILWVHLAGERLMALQRDVDRMLAPISPPERRFMSHLTIARIKRVPRPASLLEFVKACTVPELSFEVTRFSLQQSTLTPAGAVYREVTSFPLRAG